MAIDRILQRAFRIVIGYPKFFVFMSIALLIVAGVQLKDLRKDTSPNAYIPSDHPALLYQDKIKEVFGLDDPLVIAVINDFPEGIFNRNTLSLVSWLSDQLTRVPGVDPEKITSLNTTKNIKGNDEGLEVKRFLNANAPLNTETIQNLKRDLLSTPLYQGSLVTADGRGTLIVVELLDAKAAPEVYQDIMDLVARAPVDKEQIHVAGEGAVRGYLQAYMSQDARKMMPWAVLLIIVLLSFAYRTPRSVVIPIVIMSGTLLTSMGLMVYQGIAFYVITNALPVILIGIAVADSLHIFGEYYNQLYMNPGRGTAETVEATMMAMWRPVTLTSLTTMAGFTGVFLSEKMPPMAYFGLYATIGVFMALLYTFVFLPAALSLLKPKPSKALLPADSTRPLSSYSISRTLTGLGAIIYNHSGIVVGLSLAVLVSGIFAALQLRVDEERITSFRSDEKIYVADSAINKRFDGINSLNIVIETPEVEGLFNSKVLARIEALQHYVEGLPNVGGSTSIVDFLKQINLAINTGSAATYSLPKNDNLIAQYFLLYSTSGDPDDFEQYVDYNYQLANVQISLTTGRYSSNKPVIESIQAYLDTHFSDTAVKASLSGRVNVDYHWIGLLGDSHFKSVVIALLLVLTMAIVVFRSLIAGLLVLVPVACAVLFIYSVMGFFDIWLGIGTSMFAAIAIGLGVDFSVHTLERFKVLVNEENKTFKEALDLYFPSTGRVLLFNFLSVGMGFSAAMMSQVLPLVRFGAMIVIGIAISFITSVTLLPALLKLLKPGFLRATAFRKDDATASLSESVSGKTLIGAILLSALLMDTGKPLYANELPPMETIIQRLNEQDESTNLSQKMDIVVEDHRGKKRKSETQVYRKYYGEDKRMAIYYTAPGAVRGTGFLIFDYSAASKEDDQWLYLPALKRVRRISASERGEYFLGTDFTYDDIKNGEKIYADDFTFNALGKEEVNGIQTFVIECIPVAEKVARELGYSKVLRWIDPERWVILKSKHWDIAGNALKTITSDEIRRVDGIWKAHYLHAVNHKTGNHSTLFFSQVDYKAPIEDTLLTKRGLKNGL